jgi:hypothetical protein
VSAGRIVDIIVRCVGRCSVGSLNQHHFACAVGVDGPISESEMEMEMEMPSPVTQEFLPLRASYSEIA